MEKYGFEPGAKWKNSPDSPHFQVKGCRGTTYSHPTPQNGSQR
ncbi:MAG: M15 family metallopeptidase [Lachnospiraceae bacterium]|nr:M15 family metallopeptidase [Lachnospiraceae bacterium]